MLDTVSVVVPSYNCAATLGRALSSIVQQDHPRIEIIVVDDGSTDNTRDVIGNYDSIRYVRLPENRGVSAARNVGIDMASGKYIAFLDADDEWLQHKASRQVELMERSPLRPGLVTCNACSLGDGKKYKRIENWHKIYRPARGVNVGKELLKYNFIPTPTVMVRSDVFRSVGRFNESLRTSEDLDMWVRIAFEYSIDYLDEVLVRFYDRPGSLMDTGYDSNSDTAFRTYVNHIAALCDRYSGRVSAEEKKQIIGAKYLQRAYSAYCKRQFGTSIEYCKKSIANRHRITRALTVLLRATYFRKHQ